MVTEQRRAVPTVSDPSDAIVLVVDDQEDLREAMCRMLERQGFRVLSARDAAEAEALCARHDEAIDVLLTDISLPASSGGDLARALTGVRPGLRVVYVSGLPKETAIERGLVRAEDHFVQKPFTSESLVRAVRQAARLQR